ncbi:MAG TPA: hypothetical protein VJB13_05040 [Candidatus Nanoarchaeia archaeon]|nr:hypothetical protein [Candidatus Nanoarchaeia archaeon]
MKKSVGKLLLVLFIALFLISCKPRASAGETPLDTAAALQQVKTGTQGVELRLVQDSPPFILYDQSDLIALVEVNNKGSHDLKAQDCFVQVTGFDRNIISGSFFGPRSCAEGAGVLDGKNLYNTLGGSNILEFQSSINLPAGVPDYNPTLNFLSCYHYHTIANPSVCVDPLFYQVSAQQKTCRPMDVPMGGGQGGPVGVTYVGVDMIGSRAIFEINIKNLGTPLGRVLSPFASLQNCGQSSLGYQDLDKVQFNVEMTGGGKVNCKPQDGFVRLSNGQGKIICTFDIPGASAFETPLLIDLDYSYAQSIQKSVRIIRTPQ